MSRFYRTPPWRVMSQATCTTAMIQKRTPSLRPSWQSLPRTRTTWLTRYMPSLFKLSWLTILSPPKHLLPHPFLIPLLLRRASVTIVWMTGVVWGTRVVSTPQRCSVKLSTWWRETTISTSIRYLDLVRINKFFIFRSSLCNRRANHDKT